MGCGSRDIAVLVRLSPLCYTYPLASALRSRETNRTYRALNESQELLRGTKVDDFGPRNHLFHHIKNEEILFYQSVFVGDHSFKRIKNT
jgi:hypothetical protein